MDLPCVSGDVCVSAYVSPRGRVPPRVNYQIKENIYQGDQRTNIWGEKGRCLCPTMASDFQTQKKIEREVEKTYGNYHRLDQNNYNYHICSFMVSL